MDVDSNSFGWGAVLNEDKATRGFWQAMDREKHNTFKELKAVRHAFECFLPYLQGRR